MRFVSLFAGVGGFDLGLEWAGLECVGQVEIDKKCNEVLAEHWPDVPRHDDVTTAREWADERGLVGSVDVVVGGFPCQDVSTAGRRAGIAGERSGLFWEAIAFAQHVKAGHIILENVVGLLSSNHGRDFGVVIDALVDAGFGDIEWRVLDSQFFGVPQRRRRVFIVGSAPGRRSGEVLLESESGGGDLEPGDSSEQEVASTLGGGSGGRGWSIDTDRMTFVPVVKARRAQNSEDFETWEERDVAPTLNAFDNATETRATVLAFYSTGGYNDSPAEDVSPTLKVGSSTSGAPPAVSYPTWWDGKGVSPTLDSSLASKGQMMPDKNRMFAVQDGAESVRRLTPVECERLQGFPDDWTELVADTHRYRQMGNAVTVPVVEWIGRRLVRANVESE